MLSAAAALLLATLLGLRVYGGFPAAGRPLRALSRREYAFIESATEVLFPAGGAVPQSGSDADVAGYTDSLVAEQPRRLRVLMRLLFFLLEHGTLIFPPTGDWGFRRFRRFTRLGLEARTAYLQGWHRSRTAPRRLVFTSLRAILTMGYLGHPGVLRELGLAPPEISSPLCEADLLWPAIGLPSAAIRYSRADLTDAGHMR